MKKILVILALVTVLIACENFKNEFPDLLVHICLFSLSDSGQDPGAWRLYL